MPLLQEMLLLLLLLSTTCWTSWSAEAAVLVIPLQKLHD